MALKGPQNEGSEEKRSRQQSIIATALASSLLLVAIRFLVVQQELVGQGLVSGVGLLLLSARQDLTLLLVMTSLTLFLLPASRDQKGRKRTAILFTIIISVLLVLAAVNVVAVKILGEPVNLAWLHYSDVANNTIVLRQTLSAVSASGFASLVGMMVVFAFLVFTISRLIRVSIVRKTLLLGAGLVLVASYSVDGSSSNLSHGKRLNPGVALVTSLGGGSRPGPLTRLRSDETEEKLDELRQANPVERPELASEHIRNVIVIGLESTSFKYVDVPLKRFGLTPNIREQALEHGIIFTNGYVHTPASNFFLVSLLGGIVPELSAFSMTYSYPDLRYETISDELKRHGFRTGFFNTSDNRFQSTGDFARKEGFDTVLDHRNWNCETGIYEFDNQDYDFLNTSNELCSVDAITSWIDKDPTRPFFVLFRTGMTHYPYFAGDNPLTYDRDPNLNRYMNAVRTADEAFKKLMSHLKEVDRLQETLVVLLGDHGESFGEHGNYVHGGGLFEENVHIPFILMHPTLFSGEVHEINVGLSDVAPTIADLLGIDIPRQWHGKSLFDPKRKNAVFFFSPWNGFQVGFREDDLKLVYHANTDELKLFDLSSDATEMHDISSEHVEDLERMQELLGVWLSVQEQRIAKLVAGSPMVRQVSPSGSPDAAVKIKATGTSYKSAPKAKVFLDDMEVGTFEVLRAPKTDARVATEQEISDALSEFELKLPNVHCPKRLQVYFLNDEWAGEGKTGDTDLYVKSVELSARVYRPNEYTLITKNAGGLRGTHFGLWRNGGFQIFLDQENECITSNLENN